MVVVAHAQLEAHRLQLALERAALRFIAIAFHLGPLVVDRRYHRARIAVLQLNDAKIAAADREHRLYCAHRRALRAHRLSHLS